MGARLERGLPPFGRVQRVGAMLTLFMGDEPVRRFDDAQACDTDRYGALFRHLLDAGVYVAPSQFEAMFVSTAHGESEVDGRWRRSPSTHSALMDVWDTIAQEATQRARCGARRCVPEAEREPEPVFSALLAEPRYAVGLETIYEGYLLHYGRPRLFAPPDRDTSLLLGDYLYAHGLVRDRRAGGCATRSPISPR